MTESILNSVKKVLGIEADYKAFDLDITMHINSVFATLHQLGVGPANGFALEPGATASETKWTDFISDSPQLNNVKTYVWLAVRLYFDPPPTSFTLTAMQEQKKELEWRLNVAAEASGFEGGTDANLWDLTESGEFPSEAAKGDLGIDLNSGDVWRNA